ncbi:collagenase [Pseudoalteromonas sp. MTN2-4]|uniref:collagenase n=1 Tax=Pseudoalteromonas sp. MTN2-4 TaxID=3056555 RepID=UPI0036F1E86D
MKIRALALATSVALGLIGCNTLDTKNTSDEPATPIVIVVSDEAKALVQNIVSAELDDLWNTQFDHHQAGLLLAVSEAIREEVKLYGLTSQKLERLTYYLRIFSSFGPAKDWQAGTAESLNQALLAIVEHSDFYTIDETVARIHENYATALFRLYFNEALQSKTAEHIQPLSQLVTLYGESALPQGNTDYGKVVDYAMWEVLRAGAVLSYEARRKNKEAFSDAVQQQSLLQTALVNFISSKNAMREGDDWPKQHALWALAQHYNLYVTQYWNEYYTLDEEAQKSLNDDKTSLPVEAKLEQLDNQVWQALGKDNTLSEPEKQALYSIPYVVTSFRGKSECSEAPLKGRCIEPKIADVLPIKHECSKSAYILAQAMSKKELNDSCQRLNEQVDTFHEKLATQRQPVANDFNDQLRIVIFDNHAEYNRWGQLIFDIHTDNGGMYIEGTTQDPDNIATFYTFEHFWVRPKFAVWNLNHEFVHYLDGRFNKYDTFNHFPSNMVWWSEGLAEYIAEGDNNPRAFKKAFELDEKDWPSLQEVFDTEYKDGQDRVYKWSYLAVRFMFEKHREDYLKLAHFLRTDFFDGYKKLLDESGEKYGAEFKTWLQAHKAEQTKNKARKDPKKPRQFYRYTYKDYLQPKHLKADKAHMHWQYWHENASTTEKRD